MLGESYGQGAHGLSVAKAVIAGTHNSVGGVVIAAAVHRKDGGDDDYMRTLQTWGLLSLLGKPEGGGGGEEGRRGCRVELNKRTL